MAFQDNAILVLTYICYTLALCFVIFVSYRLTLHPLSAYPGPISAKLSDLYNLYHAVLMSEHIATWRNHQSYGPVIRHGPNKLVFNTIEALQDIYHNEKASKASLYLNIMQAPNVHSVFTVIDKRQHRVKRRLIGQALNERGMRLFEPIILEQIDIFIQQLSQSSAGTKPVNMSPMLRYLTLDIITLLSFGFPLRTQEKEEYRFISEGVVAGNYFQNMKLQCPLLTQLQITEALQFVGGIREKREPYRAMLKKLIGSRMAENQDAKLDLYSMVADQINTGGSENIQTSELWAEAIFIFAAGGDTTSSLIAALFFYLSRNSDCYNKLAHEIRTSFDSSSEIRSGQKLANCQYLRACIDEALRMSPAAPGTPWREQVDTDDAPFIVDGHVIPRGTIVGVNVYSILHNEKYFPEPFVYKPERWLSEESDGKMKIMYDAFIPFSAGSRICAGKAMAYLEASVTIAKTLWHFDFEKAPGKIGELGAGSRKATYGRHRESEFQVYDVVSSTHDGPSLIFHSRVH
ncbi:cytochrome P450 [Daldinia vernicosa]|uniref:cytochrome P450 n=1 Tax=Daldinia vernicosa TaxID=114800 RepID=UPI002007C714|nr:cytochrome P450 [Daldinia vernicosa]KAI0848455.1 cytochrome P450 [Daldinia vernicosa]